MKLLSDQSDWHDYPEEFWDHSAQFTFATGFNSRLDVDSLMILPWQMDKRIKSLEAQLENKTDKDLE